MYIFAMHVHAYDFCCSRLHAIKQVWTLNLFMYSIFVSVKIKKLTVFQGDLSYLVFDFFSVFLLLLVDFSSPSFTPAPTYLNARLHQTKPQNVRRRPIIS